MNYKTALLKCALCFFILAGAQAQNTKIIPRPQEVTWGNDHFTMDKGVQIAHCATYPEITGIVKARIKKATGLALDITDSGSAEAPLIEFKYQENLAHEAYLLNISRAGIQIVASGRAGWFYGVQSLEQLLYAHSFKLPELTIEDSPRFAWRAFMLDEGRYFKGMDQVKMLLDEMALLKMNVFHWHLVDDQGWRIEIKKYPLLTEIGSKRSSTQVGPLKWDSPIQSAEVHQGFYTQEEIREIVKYAQDRHITIVPEIEMPGHSSAAIAAYSWLGTAKKEIEVPIRFGVGLQE
jgi:hexosaminidase